jgi:hypothetical protein
VACQQAVSLPARQAPHLADNDQPRPRKTEVETS